MARQTLRRRGSTLIYTALAWVVLVGFCSFGVDYGRAQLAKSELQAVADAAARAAASSLDDGVTTARSNAVSVASSNSVDGTPLTLETADVEFGTWDTTAKTFTVLSGAAQSNANAVRVYARRLRSRNTQIPMVFAQMIGVSGVDASASSVAFANIGIYGFVGLNGISYQNNCWVGSYDSSKGLPSATNYGSEGQISSNGTINFKNNNYVLGDVILGPSGSLTMGNGSYLSGTEKRVGNTISYPAASAGTAATTNNNANIGKTVKNKNALSGDALTVPKNDTLNLAAGTYYFSSLTLNNNGILNCTGAVTIYIDGPITFDNESEVHTYLNRPINLKIRQLGNNTCTFPNQMSISADIYAPGCDMNAGNYVGVFGSGVWRSIDIGDATLTNGAYFLWDESMGSASSSVQSAGSAIVVR